MDLNRNNINLMDYNYYFNIYLKKKVFPLLYIFVYIQMFRWQIK